MRLTFSIQRYNPEVDTHAHEEDYRLEVGRGMTVLDGLIRVQNELDGALSFRYSCRSAICGSCAMTINGHEKLACRTSVRKELERHGRIRIAPLRNLPVIKDLVVDMSSFWSKVRDIMPWLAVSSERPGRLDTRSQLTLLPGTYDFHNVDACIMCGACLAACTSHEVSKGFLGPAALAKADRFLEDPREPETTKRLRLKELDQPNGMWDCVRCNFCVEVCPKDVRPMEAIIRLRRGALNRGLTASGGARHIEGFVQLVQHEGRLNEAVMPLKVIGWNLKRLLHVFPLGVRMWLKGKVPNPLAQPIQGIWGIRSIFASRSRRVRSGMSASFRILDDIAVADVAFEATGRNPSELFVSAAQAVIDILANPATIGKVWHRTIEIADDHLGDLLFDWLSEIVYLKDAEGVVFCNALASVVHDSAHGCWRLHAELCGEPIDPARQELRSDVKAVTRHLYEIGESGAQWRARVVLDI